MSLNWKVIWFETFSNPYQSRAGNHWGVRPEVAAKPVAVPVGEEDRHPDVSPKMKVEAEITKAFWLTKSR